MTAGLGILLTAGLSLAAPSVVDDLGRRVELEAPPQRIVSTAPANCELLYALGAGEQVVGVTRHCAVEAAAGLPRVGDFAALDVERILSLEPDLVVATGLAQERWVQELERHGLRVLVLHPPDLEGVMHAIELLGHVLDAERRAAELVAEMRERLERVDRVAAELDQSARPAVLVLVTLSPAFTAGPGSHLDELIRRAGGRNVYGDLDRPYANVGLESMLERDPEVILLAHEVGSGEGAALLASLPGLAATRALREGRVIDDIPPPLLVQPSHRLVEGLERLQRALLAGRDAE